MTKGTLPFSLYPLDKRFIGPKPIEEAPISTFHKLEDENDLIIERKRNGHCSFTVVGGVKNGIEIYSSGINSLTNNVPAIVEEIRSIGLPRDTMFAAELFVDVDGYDDLGKFGSIARSNKERAIELQKDTPVQMAIFNIITRGGKSVIESPYQDRLNMLGELFAKHTSQYVHIVEPLSVSFDEARKVVVKKKWEGLVLYSKKAGSMFKIDENRDRVPRPEGCWKWKPYNEGDFVATGWIPSTSNKFKGQVRDLLIAQYDPVTDKLVPWGKVGTGLNAAQKKEYTDDSLYPMVFEVKFERRTSNNRLISAHILRRRFDKEPRECYSPEVSK